MVEPRFQESIGFMARVMKNFGLKQLRLVRPRAKLGATARMRASHAQDVLNAVQVVPSLKRAIEDANLSAGTTAQRARSLFRILRRPLSPETLSGNLAGVTGTVALVFGREGTGLTNAELDLCDMVLTIPASAEYPTLNISHAAATVFYELYKRSKSAPTELLANEKLKEACLTFLDRASASAALTERERGLVLRAFRNMMGRSAVRAREASALTGALRAIASSLENSDALLPSSGAGQA